MAASGNGVEGLGREVEVDGVARSQDGGCSLGHVLRAGNLELEAARASDRAEGGHDPQLGVDGRRDERTRAPDGDHVLGRIAAEAPTGEGDEVSRNHARRLHLREQGNVADEEGRGVRLCRSVPDHRGGGRARPAREVRDADSNRCGTDLQHFGRGLAELHGGGRAPSRTGEHDLLPGHRDVRRDADHRRPTEHRDLEGPRLLARHPDAQGDLDILAGAQGQVRHLNLEPGAVRLEHIAGLVAKEDLVGGGIGGEGSPGDGHGLAHLGSRWFDSGDLRSPSEQTRREEGE